MKIAFIVGGFPRTTETFILSQIAGLIDLGHEVDIYAKRRYSDSAVHADVFRYGLLERTHYFDTPDTRLARVVRGLRSVWVHGARNPAAMLRCASITRSGSLYSALSNAIYVEPFLRKQYDIFMCHFGTNAVDFIFLKDIFPCTRFVTMFHGGCIRLAEEEGAGVYDSLRQRGDLFLAISDSYNRRKLVAFGFDEAKIVTHRIGIDCGKIAYQTKVREPSSLRLLTVGRLGPEKGLQYAIRAVANLCRRHPELRIEYRIVGDGGLKEPLTALVGELEMADRVRLVGALPTDEVIRAMHDCDLFVLPSLAEATPTVLLEAQATGTPVVATNVGAVAEIIQDGQSGFLVPAADPDAIEAKLTYLADRPLLCVDMGRAGRRFVEEQHDSRVLNKRLLGLFTALLRNDLTTDVRCP